MEYMVAAEVIELLLKAFFYSRIIVTFPWYLSYKASAHTVLISPEDLEAA